MLQHRRWVSSARSLCLGWDSKQGRYSYLCKENHIYLLFIFIGTLWGIGPFSFIINIRKGRPTVARRLFLRGGPLIGNESNVPGYWNVVLTQILKVNMFCMKNKSRTWTGLCSFLFISLTFNFTGQKGFCCYLDPGKIFSLSGYLYSN